MNNQAINLPDDVVLSVRGVSKKFCRNLRRSMLYGMQDLGRNLLGLRPGTEIRDSRLDISAPNPQTPITNNESPITNLHSPLPNLQSPQSPASGGSLRRDEFWAVENVSVDLHRGEILGIIGANGSGKSTLLRVLTGIFPPDVGEVRVRGRLGGLIALGAGFHPHMTGRENIYLNGTVLGLTRKQVEAQFQDIVDFAEIGEFMEAPVSTYSSGMYVRLGFAIAIHTLPDIVLLDEVLAVGDARFQRKCLDRIREMRKKDKSFILVSHNMQNIEAMCDRVLWLDHGQQTRFGAPGEVVPEYELSQIKGETEVATRPSQRLDRQGLQHLFSYQGFGTNEVQIESLLILDREGIPRTDFSAMDPATVSITLTAAKELIDAYVWLAFIHVEDQTDLEKDVTCVGVRIKTTIPKGQVVMNFPFERLQFATGLYKISLCIFDDTFLQPYSQGHYGYFTVKNPVPTMLRTVRGSPFFWLQPGVTINGLKVSVGCP